MSELERFVPGMPGPIWYEHWHRYHFAAPLVAGRSVVDIACGEGYGSALMATRAAHVRGVDVSREVVAAARERYRDLPRLEFLEGRCEAIPAGDQSVDAVVSFETIEHIAEPVKLVAEARRILRPGGMLVVSTPNKSQYTDAAAYHNEYHVSEMYHDEFVSLLESRFPAVRLYGQRVAYQSVIWPMARTAPGVQLLEADCETAAAAAPRLPAPLYYVALCAEREADLDALAAPLSLLADREATMDRRLAAAEAEAASLRAHAARLEAAYIETQRRLAALARERAAAAVPPAPGPRR